MNNSKVDKSKTNSEIRIYGMFIVLFLITGLFVFLNHMLSSKTLLYADDGFNQYYPMLIHLRNELRDFKHNGFASSLFNFWDWSIGLGDDKIGVMYSTYMNPFSYIAVLFKPKYMDVGYGVAVYATMFAMGIHMLGFLRRRKIESMYALVGALSYSYSFFAVYGTSRAFFFGLPMVIFPLLIDGVLLWSERRKSAKLIISIMISFASCPYFAYMTGILTVIFLLVYYGMLLKSDSEKYKSIKSFFSFLGAYVVHVVIGLLLALPFALPSVMAILNADHSSTISPDWFFTLKKYLMYFPSLAECYEGFFSNFSGMFCGTVVFSLIPITIFYIIKRKLTSANCTFVILAILILLPFFDSVLNGFSYPAARWVYAFDFFYVWSSIESLDNLSKLKNQDEGLVTKIGIVLISLLVGSLVLRYFLFNGSESLVCIGVLITIEMTMALYFCLKGTKEERKKKYKVLILTVIGIIIPYLCYFCTINSVKDTKASDCTSKGQSYKAYSNSPLNKIEIDEEDFYRIGQTQYINNKGGIILNRYGNANESVYSGTPSLADGYFSVNNKSVSQFFKLLNVNGSTFSRNRWHGVDCRSRINFLLGAKYYYSSEENQIYINPLYNIKARKEKKKNIYELYESKYETGLGYVYSSTLKRREISSLSEIEIEQLMMQTAICEDDYAGESKLFNISESSLNQEKIPFRIECSEGIELKNKNIKVDKSNATIVLTPLNKVKNDEIEVCFSNFKRIPTDKQQLKQDKLYPKSNSKPTLSEIIQFDLSHFQEKYYSNFSVIVDNGYANKSFINYAGQNNHAIADVKDFCVNLGYYEEYEEPITLTFQTAGTYSFDDISLYGLPIETFDEQAQKLSENRLVVSDWSGDKVVGTVDSDGGMLFLSIPYNKGWSAYVDGEKVPMYKINIGFMGIDVTSGQHDIVLKYRPYGIEVAVALSVFAIGLWIAFALYVKKKSKEAI